MPAIYTHYRFSQSVYEKLDKNVKKNITKDQTYYKIFSQSFDNLFYYNFFLFQTENKYQRLGGVGHTTNVNLYFENIIDFIIENNLESNKILREYLYGSINHYVLDSTIHPYVFYKTGVFRKKEKETFKYNGLHTRLEFMLDAYFYKLDTNMEYKNYDIAKNLVPRLKFPTELIDSLDYTFLNTFDVENVGRKFEKSYKHCNWIFKYIIYDKFGIKSKLFKFYDFLNNNRGKAYKYNTTYVKNIDESILNLKNKTWCNPLDKSIKSNDSVIDLYEQATIKSVNLITKVNKVLNGKMDKEAFLKELGNNSYRTGLDLNKKGKMRYFEF